MKNDISNHKRGSQWIVIGRCLKILRRLLRGNPLQSELLDIIYEVAEREGEELSRNAAQKRFEEDKRRLADWFYCDIQYHRSLQEYELLDIGIPLLDLNESSVRGLAFLDSAFSANEVPMRDEVQSVIQQIKMLLSAERRRDIDRQRDAFEMDLRQRDEDEIPDEVREKLLSAISEKRQLEFDYSSPQQTDGLPRRHLVEPMRYFFDAIRGHFYLEAFCLQTYSLAYGHQPQNQLWMYRPRRIENILILPKHFVPRKSFPKYELVYQLTPDIVRSGVTKHIQDSIVTPPQADGSVIVHAMSKNLFFDLRTLLHYGHHCRVIGGEEAVKQMTLIVEQMYERYKT